MKPWFRWVLIVLGIIVVAALLLHGCKKVSHWVEEEHE